ncbi:MAG TPA: C4-dicarboxylate ABC transporter substrate-binding protein, partial [Planctomycetota bacterium]|nr:C4-dicarboxylate ABC transporter substrate-binding protein [Planctomycetota bacterium]
EVAKMGVDAIDAMKKNGLQVLSLNDDERAQWRAAAEKTWPVIRGGVVSNEDFDAVRAARDQYRAEHAKK